MPALCVVLSQQVCVHDPTLPRLGLGLHPFNVAHEFAQISRHEDFILGAEA
jgi:hypothetical protein